MADIRKLNGYYQALKSVGLRKDFQFQITIEQIDSEIQSGGLGESMKFTFFAESASVPGLTQSTIETMYHGMTFRNPGNLEFESPWTVSVRCDSEMKIRDAVEKWVKNSADLTKGGGGDKKVPSFNAKVDLLDDELETIQKTYVLEGVFPQSIAELTLDHTSNEISRFDLGIAYQYWYPTTDESGQGDDPLQTIDT